jgi:hypothetical protein
VSLPRNGVGGASRSDLGPCIGMRRSRLGGRVSYGISQRRKRRYCRPHLQCRPSSGEGLTALAFLNAAIPQHRLRVADPPVDADWTSKGPGTIKLLSIECYCRGINQPRKWRKGRVVDKINARDYRYFLSARSLRDEPSLSHQSVAGAPPKLTVGASLIVALLLSLGLWGAIWLALSSLASAFS